MASVLPLFLVLALFSLSCFAAQSPLDSTLLCSTKDGDGHVLFLAQDHDYYAPYYLHFCYENPTCVAADVVKLTEVSDISKLYLNTKSNNGVSLYEVNGKFYGDGSLTSAAYLRTFELDSFTCTPLDTDAAQRFIVNCEKVQKLNPFTCYGGP